MKRREFISLLGGARVAARGARSERDAPAFIAAACCRAPRARLAAG
jgi:hypothetical protein